RARSALAGADVGPELATLRLATVPADRQHGRGGRGRFVSLVHVILRARSSVGGGGLARRESRAPPVRGGQGTAPGDVVAADRAPRLGAPAAGQHRAPDGRARRGRGPAANRGNRAARSRRTRLEGGCTAGRRP